MRNRGEEWQSGNFTYLPFARHALPTVWRSGNAHQSFRSAVQADGRSHYRKLSSLIGFVCTSSDGEVDDGRERSNAKDSFAVTGEADPSLAENRSSNDASVDSGVICLSKQQDNVNGMERWN